MKRNRFFILIAALSLLSMLIPVAAAPVSANSTGPYFSPLVDANGVNAWDIVGDIEQFTIQNLPPGITVKTFSVADQAPGTGAVIVATNPPSTNTLPAKTAGLVSPGGTGSWVKVQASTIGQAVISANLSGPLPDGRTQIMALKKWGEINATIITPPQDVPVVWSESNKSFGANAFVEETVTGTFFAKNETNGQFTVPEEHPASGAILNWFLVKDTPAAEAFVAANSANLPATTLLDNFKAANLAPATFSGFVDKNGINTGKTAFITTSDENGKSHLAIFSKGEEAILVIVIPQYSIPTQFPVMLEWTKVNFWTSEMEKVPQVRWAGEKIVLEKFFGQGMRETADPFSVVPWTGTLVRFSLENQSPGALEGIGPFATGLGNLTNTAQTVWGIVGEDGYARCMLVSEDQGEIDVDLAVYDVRFAATSGFAPAFTRNDEPGQLLNQHGFVVFYLKLESVSLTDVVGSRVGHDSGLFTPPNPWDVTKDVAASTVNVSQDNLLRARVKGWFLGDNRSNRPEAIQDADPNNPGQFLFTLPAGRWVLPDDWPVLAGPNWREMRLHWDIMDNPFDTVGAPAIDPLGTPTDNLGKGSYYNPYNPTGTRVAAFPVIGPFRPGLEMPTAPIYSMFTVGTVPAGTLIGAYNPLLGIPLTSDVNPYVKQKTVVPNGVLEWWDAPMPPAKITFEIQNVAVTGDNGIQIGAAGFFKDAFKTDIYYVLIGTAPNQTKVYTAPFYWEMIPAFSWIPAFVNNGGYDWDSWNTAYGPYQFWKIFNRPANDMLPAVTRSNILRDNGNFPSKVQVYSDNHGEAMVYINGDYNLNPSILTFKGVEPALGSIVASTSVAAIADYPYFRKHNQIVSTPVVKTWTWGGMVVGPGNSPDRMILAVGNYSPVSTTDGTSNDLLVFVWATDRNGRQAGVIGTQVDWVIGPAFNSVKIPDISVPGDGVRGISNFNSTMRSIGLEHGFLKGTNGMLTGAKDGTQATSFMRPPTVAEAQLFNKFWGAGGTIPIMDADGNPIIPANFVVAAIDLLDVTETQNVTVTETLKSPDFGTLIYSTNVNFAVSHPLDDNILPGDANLDGKVSVADITAIERIILGLNPPNVQADANINDKIDMGDVVRTERIIMGLR